MRKSPVGAAGLLQRLARSRPGSRRAEKLRWELEGLIMSRLKKGGPRRVKAMVAQLVSGGNPFIVKEASVNRKIRGSILWWELPLGDRVVAIRAAANRIYRSVSVSYDRLRPLTAKQREVHELQQIFYRRYNAAARRAYRLRPPRLTPKENRVLLIGELEADVNNGGFSQYLGNKGRRRALAALRALRAIGAARTARLLSSALKPAAPEKDLHRLSERFWAVPEDLAMLAVRKL